MGEQTGGAAVTAELGILSPDPELKSISLIKGAFSPFQRLLHSSSHSTQPSGRRTQHPAPRTLHGGLSTQSGHGSILLWLAVLNPDRDLDRATDFFLIHRHSLLCSQQSLFCPEDSAPSTQPSQWRTQHPALSREDSAPSTCLPGEQHTLALQTPGQQLPHTGCLPASLDVSLSRNEQTAPETRSCSSQNIKCLLHGKLPLIE